MMHRDQTGTIEVQLREESHRFIKAVELYAVPRIGETVHIAGDKPRKVLDVVHAVDDVEQIVICVVSE